MKRARIHLSAFLVAVAWLPAIAAAPVRADPQPSEVLAAATDLAQRLQTSPPVSNWVSESDREATFQGDVNRIANLAVLLASELSAGKGREETASTYYQLREVGLKILSRSRAYGQTLPAGDRNTYEALLSKLEAYYGPPRAK